MKIHRHIRTSVWVSALAAAIAISFILVIEYRTEKLVKLIVENQSQGGYRMEIDDLGFSFFRHQLELQSAIVQQMDSARLRVRATLQLPRLYLRITSWSELIVNKRLLIDSVMVFSPSFETSIDTVSRNVAISFQAAEVIKELNKVVALLNVRSLQLQDGRLLLHRPGEDEPFEISRISISIRNLGGSANRTDPLQPADELDLVIGDQQWKFGDLDIGFRRLHFAGSAHSLGIDSFQFASQGNPSGNSVIGEVARVYFESDSLTAFFDRGELILDTLLCVRPVVKVHLVDQSPADTGSSEIVSVLRTLFPEIQVRHLSVTDGQFLAKSTREGKSLTYASRETDLRVGDLAFHPNQSRYLTVGDIGLQLRQITFYSPDSLYQLKVEEFDLYNTEIGFRNAVFSPAGNNSQSLFLTIPVLLLHRFRLEDLLEGRLGADRAVMNSPEVIIEAAAADPGGRKAKRTRAAFYDALRGLSQLLRVKTLSVNQGTINFHSPGRDSLSATMSDFNSTILLENFLQSTSAGDIKRSFTFFRIGEINVRSGSMNALISDFHLEGSGQLNGIGRILFTSASGISLSADNFVWHNLIYDSLFAKRAILADSVHTDRLSVDVVQSTKAGQGTLRDFPVLRIRRVATDKFNLHYSFLNGGVLTAKGKDYLLSDLSTATRAFLWSNAQGEFTGVKYKSEALTASADKLNLHTPGTSKFKDVKVSWENESSSVSAKIPEIKMKSKITSSNISSLQLNTLSIDEPRVNLLLRRGGTQPANTITVPFDLLAGELKISKGKLDAAISGAGDTMRIVSGFVVQSDSLQLRELHDEMLTFGTLNVTLENLNYSDRMTEAAVPVGAFRLHNGKVVQGMEDAVLECVMEGNWNNVSLSMNGAKKSSIEASAISGELKQKSLYLNPNEKQRWLTWLDDILISDGRILFRDSANTVSFASTEWDGSSHTLHLDSFMFKPNVSEEDHFLHSTWQSDYVAGIASSVDFSGVDPAGLFRDSLVHVHRINVAGANIQVTRDKRIPFQHGREKAMPTHLIDSVKRHFRIDSVLFQNSSVFYNEYSNLTNRMGVVPIENISATLKNLSNHHESRSDTLALKGRGWIYNSHISKFSYKEVYNDSLAAFSLTVKISPSELSEFGKMTRPLAAIDVSSGTFDTMLARISGNKYASVGAMRFDYRDLKIQLLNPEDTLAKRLGLSFVNFVANSFVIKSENKKPSAIFFVRDRERFVFNYWMKSILSGILTSAGIKRNGKYEKEYRKMKKQYKLPPAEF